MYTPPPVNHNTAKADTVREAEEFCSSAFAVLWLTGGGVYITHTDSHDGYTWAESLGHKPSQPVAFDRISYLRWNCAPAEKWIHKHFEGNKRAEPDKGTPTSQDSASQPNPQLGLQRHVTPEFARAIQFLAKLVPKEVPASPAAPTATPQPTTEPACAPPAARRRR